MEILTILLIFAVLLAFGSSATSYLLRIWFDGATFFLEYVRLFRLGWFFTSTKKFSAAVEKGLDSSYLDFLQATKPNSFVAKLVTCEKCMSVWAAMLVCLPPLLVIATYNLALLAVIPIVIAAIAEAGYCKYKEINNGKNN